MKARVVILLLSIISLTGAVAGGYFYFSTMRNLAVARARQEVEAPLQQVAERVRLHVNDHKKEIRALAGVNALKQALHSKGKAGIKEADAILLHFQRTLEADVCYLMDRDGRTIASSNYETPVSFVGKNYAFRPYFQQAIEGDTSLYFALGVTSNKRGAYFSAPVYLNNGSKPAGVVVMKVAADHLEDWLKQLTGGYVMLLSPEGLIFASNRADWLYHLLWQVTPAETAKIAASNQFGTGPWEWTGMRRISESYAVDRDGNKYLIHPLDVDLARGWQFIYLQDLKKLSKKIFDRLFAVASYFVLALCLIIVVSVFALYRKAHREIITRKALENKLRKISTTDDLTELLNRRGFFSLAGQQMKVAERVGEDLFLLYTDLDNLKLINDSLGHETGDQALREAAAVLRSTFREADIIGRLGGDEFAVMFTSAENAATAPRTVLTRLDEGLAEFNRKSQKSYQLHMSIGVVPFDKARHKSLDDLLSEADALMYEQKKKKKKAFRTSERTH